MKLRGIAIAFIILAAFPSRAEIQGPRIGQDVALRTRDIRRIQRQRIAPTQWNLAIQQLTAMDMNSAQFQEKISTAPLQVRLEVFRQKTQPQVATFDRRVRGMLKAGKTNRVAKPSKKVFEVMPDNFDLFRKVMGPNMLWFNIPASPGHLHTLIADQAGGAGFHHNVYGTQTDAARHNSGQYGFPVVLTDKEMDRFVRYLNAGMQASGGNSYSDGKLSVYGFYNRGQLITGQGNDGIRCTNWATSAPIGELPRWACVADRKLQTMNLQNVPEVLSQGLHAALAAAPDAAARADIVARVLANRELVKGRTRRAVKSMARAFNKETTQWPNRPRDLVLRGSLAEMLGLNRSRDPAKWSYDLMMSKRVPVVAVFNGTPNADFPNMIFNMEVMGLIGPDGKVINGNGAVPAGR